MNVFCLLPPSTPPTLAPLTFHSLYPDFPSPTSGGRYEEKDKVWQDYFADFLLDRCLNDQFTWTLNPSSADTGGLLKADWVTPEEGKLAVVGRVQPNPSFLARDPTTGQICLAPGSYANPAKCAPRGSSQTKQRQRRRLFG